MSVIVQAAEAIRVGCPSGNGCMGSIISVHPGATPATESVHCGECGDNYCGYCLLRSAQRWGGDRNGRKAEEGARGEYIGQAHIQVCAASGRRIKEMVVGAAAGDQGGW